MKQLTTYNRAAGYLNRIFDITNEVYFESTLTRPVITIQSTPKAYGHFTLFNAWEVKGEGQKEINIGAGTLARPIEEVVATMLHEMVHYYCYINGIQDTSRSGTYHNRRFKAEAEKRGLSIGCHPSYGWTLTEPTEGLLETIISYGLTDILMSHNAPYSVRAGGIGGKTGAGGAAGAAPKKSSTRKYICPCCKTSIRATKAVNILCGDCMEQMQPAAL
ncbi:SprT-like family protein [Butyricicoccus sp. 1XD8-22]|nr:SprT-like family protein [Butyricicoccus sp. 1XD8-22]